MSFAKNEPLTFNKCLFEDLIGTLATKKVTTVILSKSTESGFMSLGDFDNQSGPNPLDMNLK